MSGYSIDWAALRERLRWLRQEVTDNQAGFAGMVHSTQQTVSRWESGEVLPPFKTLIEVGLCLGIKPTAFAVYLLDGSTDALPKLFREALRLHHPELRLNTPSKH